MLPTDAAFLTKEHVRVYDLKGGVSNITYKGKCVISKRKNEYCKNVLIESLDSCFHRIRFNEQSSFSPRFLPGIVLHGIPSVTATGNILT